MKISYPYDASYEIFDPHALDFSRKAELGQGRESRGGELSKYKSWLAENDNHSREGEVLP